MEIIKTLLLQAGLPAAVLGFGIWLLERKIANMDAKREKRSAEQDDQRRKYELIMLNMTFASLDLSIAVAKAVQKIPEAHCNGDMHSALEKADAAKRDFNHTINDLALASLERKAS